MARKKATAKTYVVTVKNNPKFVGKGAGGVQFAKGKAEGVNERMAQWFKEHKGYIVTETEAETETETEAEAE